MLVIGGLSLLQLLPTNDYPALVRFPFLMNKFWVRHWLVAYISGYSASVGVLGFFSYQVNSV